MGYTEVQPLGSWCPTAPGGADVIEDHELLAMLVEAEHPLTETCTQKSEVLVRQVQPAPDT